MVGSKMRWGVGLGLLLCGAFSLVGCDDEGDAAADAGPAPSMGGDPELVAHLQDTYGLRLVLLEANQRVDEDGSTHFEERYRVEIDGFPPGTIEVEQTLFPAAEGGAIELEIVDEQTGDVRSFTWSIDENYISMSSQVDDGPARGATIFPEADGSYTVHRYADGAGDELEVEVDTQLSGRRAVDLVDDQIDFTQPPPRVMMAAFAIAHTSPPEARAAQQVAATIPGNNGAAAPPVSDVFSEFCDCVPCWVLDRPELCARCPDM